MKGCEEIVNANSNQKRAEVAKKKYQAKWILSGKIIIGDKEGHVY